MTYLWPPKLRDQACQEVYEYIDKNIKKLPRREDGSFDEVRSEFHRNEVDALRHAYVSGVFTQEYNEKAADIFGRLNELVSYGSRSQGSDIDRNMDLWNNAVGRKYGLQSKDRLELLKMLHNSLIQGELITTLTDARIYEGASTYPIDDKSKVIVLKESSTGRNEIFLDLSSGIGMTKADFVAKIKTGLYKQFTVATINGEETPMSLRDNTTANNLG